MKDFVDQLFSNTDVKPSQYDRSYYPTRKDIKNHIHLTALKQKLSQIDQVNLGELIEQWKREDPTRCFHLRPCTDEGKVIKVDEENQEEDEVDDKDEYVEEKISISDLERKKITSCMCIKKNGNKT